MVGSTRPARVVLGFALASLLAVLAACGPHLAPRADWRIVPVDVEVDAHDSDILAEMAARRDGSLAARGRASLTIALAPTRHETMLTFSRNERSRKVQRSSWTARMKSGRRWATVGGEGSFRGGLERVILPPSETPSRVEVRFEGARLRIRDVGLYELRRSRDDVWLAVGASIQEGGFSHRVFKQVVREEHGYDPVVFNRAVSGWTAGKLRRNLPRILREHPEARYVAIHIGGNDVSVQRPYPGGARRLRKNLEAIIRIVQKDNRIPIVARLSYRAYTKAPATPPDENGSGPYVEAIYDPLIDELTPAFSTWLGCGVVDPYRWYQDHPDQLARDGIHPNREGRRSWATLWARQAGDVVY